jgi:hypothetical protein
MPAQSERELQIETRILALEYLLKRASGKSSQLAPLRKLQAMMMTLTIWRFESYCRCAPRNTHRPRHGLVRTAESPGLARNVYGC